MSQFLPDALEQLLKESGVPFKRKSRSFLLTCPRCGKKDKLWILKKNGAFVCWRCQELDNFKGWAPDALSEILGLTPSQVRAKIYEGYLPPGNELEFDLTDFENPDFVDIQPSVELPTIEWPWDSVDLDHPSGQKGIQYLLGRGIPESVARKYGCRYWPAAKRVLFPVTHDGRLVGYQGRAIVPSIEPKILTSAGLRREYALMFESNLDQAHHAVVCEGPIDAIKADFCRGNVATMGKAVTKPQLELIRKRDIKTVYLALDPDAAEEVTRLAVELGDLETRLLLPPAGRKDLGECEFEEVWEAFVNAEPFTSGNLFFDLKVPT